MSRADDASTRSAQVLLKIREAAEHRKASILFAIGAERPSPQSAASEAYALGLTVQEEKLAKWVAVAKRDSEKLFGKPFLAALQDILKEGESEMEVQRGKGFFADKAKPLIIKFFLDALRDGVLFKSSFEEVLTLEKLGEGENMSCCFSRANVPENLFYPRITQSSHSHRATAILVSSGESNRDFMSYCTDDSGFEDLGIHVSDKRAMKATRKFGHAWERKSKQLKGSRTAHVTIYQDFA